VYWHLSETHGYARFAKLSVRTLPEPRKQFLSISEQLTLEKRSFVPDTTMFAIMRVVSTIDSRIETLRPTSVISNRRGTRRGYFGFPRPSGPADQTAAPEARCEPLG
jgi:hypothetical protein